MMENEENNNLIINENGEAVFEPDDSIIKQDSFTEEQKYLIKSITSYSAKKIYKNAFCEFEELVTVNLPNATTIDDDAFYSCRNLATIYLANAKTIGHDAFCNCLNLVNIYLPKATKIDYCAFYSCRNLKTIYLPKANEIGEMALGGCQNLNTIYIPKVSSIDNNEFYENLEKIHVSDQELCEKIYSMLNEELKRKAKSNKLTIYYGDEVVFQPPEAEERR